MAERDADDNETKKPAWMQRAKCLGLGTETAMMYAEQSNADVQRAKAICNGLDAVGGICRVRQDCLTYAIENRERFGVWGGMSERERRREARRRGLRTVV